MASHKTSTKPEEPDLSGKIGKAELTNPERGACGLESVDTEDLSTKDSGRPTAHKYKLRKKPCLRDIKKHSFPNKTIDL